MLRVDCLKYNEDFEALASATCETLGLSGDAVVEVDFVSKEEIHELNLSTRGVDRVTDVLSYPALNNIKPFTKQNYPFDYNDETREVELGSIVICSDIAKEQSVEYRHSERRENCYLFVHGLMHLMGYDHIEDSDRAVMREKEEIVLNKCGIVRGE